MDAARFAKSTWIDLATGRACNNDANTVLLRSSSIHVTLTV